jgi:hypothetical protein
VYRVTVGINVTNSGDKIVHRGIVSSEEIKGVISEPGDDTHYAAILTNNPDGSIYSGIIAITATNPLEIG